LINVSNANALGAWWRHLKAVPEKTSILREGAWIVLGQLLGAAGLLIGIRLLTEFVSPDVFGTVSLLIGIVTLGSNIFCAPQLQAALRFYPDLSREQSVHRLRATVRHALVWATALLVGVILSIGILASLMGFVPYWTFVALAALFVSEVVRTFETNLLTAARRQKPFALWQAAENWARPCLAVAVVLSLGATPYAVLSGYAAATAGLVALMPLWIHKEGYAAGPLQPPDIHLARRIQRYAVPLMPLAIIGWIGSLSDRYIIGGLIDMHAVGLYAATYGLISRPFLMMFGVIATTLRPVYFNKISGGDHNGARSVFLYWVGVTLMFAAAGVALICLFKFWIAEVFLAEPFRSGVELMPWIALGYGVVIIFYTIEQFFYAYQETQLILLMQTVGAVTSLAVTFPMVYWLGVQGAAVAVPIYFSVSLIMGAFFLLPRQRMVLSTSA
jgi:O-antigen/teichoic acid export membrane protein